VQFQPGLQEAAAQRFDDFVSRKGTPGENVSKMSAKRIEDTRDTAEFNIGVRGFEPPTT